MFSRKQTSPGQSFPSLPKKKKTSTIFPSSRQSVFALIEELERRAGLREFLERRDVIKREYQNEENQCSAQPCKEETTCALSKMTTKGFHCIPLKGQWNYVFGAKNGTSKKVYETWLDDNYKCTDPQCDIYKNEFVSTWKNRKILKAEKNPCLICGKIDGDDGSDDMVVLRDKGATTVNKFSDLHSQKDLIAKPGDRVHASCRKAFTDERKIRNTNHDSHLTSPRLIRSTSGLFNPRQDCLFCGVEVDFTRRRIGLNEVHKVQTDNFGLTVKQCCSERNDDWAHVVRGRFAYCEGELHAYDCVYHGTCRANFCTGKNIPLQFTINSPPTKKFKPSGRPVKDELSNAFDDACGYLIENRDGEQVTLSSLVDYMKSRISDPDLEVYSPRYLKQNLCEHFGERIIISGSQGTSDIITVRETANFILRTYFKESKDGDLRSQKLRIIEAASEIIKDDIQTEIESDMSTYTVPGDVSCERSVSYLPETLRLFLSKLVTGNDTDVKRASIGQCIVQGVRPRSLIAPLQLGLAVQMHHSFRSRFLVESLHAMGFSVSYDEVLRFERNAALVSDSNIPALTNDSVVIMSADNVDHNTCTLDGQNTLHGMGMIASFSPKCIPIDRIRQMIVSSLDIRDVSSVKIYDYYPNTKLRKPLIFKEISDLHKVSWDIDILWELSFSLKTKKDWSNWSGSMHALYSTQIAEHLPQPSSVIYLPIIGLHPSDMSCIFSTLIYMSNLARQHLFKPIITFDQPLFWKASMIVNESDELSSCCLILGGFHTIMNLLGAIGTLMEGSGLREVTEEVYAENAVSHILTGKAYSRALRAHLLVNTALFSHLLEELFFHHTEQDTEAKACKSEFEDILVDLGQLWDDLLSGSMKIPDVSSNKGIADVTVLLEAGFEEMRERSLTGAIWLEYRQMFSVVLKLLRADRLGNFDLQKEALRESLPIFAAAGHHNYLKSARLYLQNLVDLESEHGDVYQQFSKHGICVRRSERIWAGLPPDMIIEQVLMRSLKTSGGLTRGSGMSDVQRAVWLGSMPACSEFNTAMQGLTDVSFESSEQHKDISVSRVLRDNSDVNKVLNIFRANSPVTDDSTLRDIVTRVTAGPDVDVYKVFLVGEQIVRFMDGHDVFEFSIKRNQKAKTMLYSMAVELPDKTRVDPSLLFQRLYVLASSCELNIEQCLKYEMCSFPPALFEAQFVLRKADKPPLAKAVVSQISKMNPDAPDIVKTEVYVLDGGSLLRRLPWQKGLTYHEIAQSYANFVLARYGKAHVVIDGYDEQRPSTKDITHQRRSKATSSAIKLSKSTKFICQRDVFLSNDSNKQRIINLIGEGLIASGCGVSHADGDADLEIVRKTVECANSSPTTLIGEDTDLLVLLLFMGNDSKFNIYFRSDVKRPGVSSNTIYDIHPIQTTLELPTCRQLLFLHSFTGCDTTSRIHSVGKQKSFSKLLIEPVLQNIADKFLSPYLTVEEVEKYGEQAMVILCGGNSDENLMGYRHRSLAKKVSSSKCFVKPENLPPTPSATKFHSMRCYHQVQVWMGNCEQADALIWGWNGKNSQMLPLTTELPAAPESLMKIISCNCSTGCTNSRCSCRKHDLKCTNVCGKCQSMNNCCNLSDNQPTTDE